MFRPCKTEIGYFLKLGSPISPLGFPLNMPKHLDDFGVSHCGKPRVGLRGRLQQTYCMYLPVKTMVSVYQTIENSNIALQNYATVPNHACEDSFFLEKGREKYNTCVLERKDHGSDDKLIMLNTFQSHLIPFRFKTKMFLSIGLRRA